MVTGIFLLLNSLVYVFRSCLDHHTDVGENVRCLDANPSTTTYYCKTLGKLLTSLHLSYSICKVGLTAPTSLVYWEG